MKNRLPIFTFIILAATILMVNNGLTDPRQNKSNILKIWHPPLPLDHLARLKIRPYYPQENQQSAFNWPGSLFFQGDAEWLVAIKNNLIFYRPNKQADFTPLNLSLNRPHAITYNPEIQIYYIADTDNNRLLYGPDPFNPASMRSAYWIAGTRLIRPHDLLFNDEDKKIYLLTSSPVKLFRFKEINGREEVFDLSDTITYARAISLIEGKIYVTGSAEGKIVRIDDFQEKKITVFQSGDKKRTAYAGTWQSTGLIINDIEKYKNFWYVSSYFTREYCPSLNCDYNQNKLIRFRSWSEFQTGEWQDISHFLPDNLTPYFFTLNNQQLYLGLFNHSAPSQGNFIYAIKN